MSNVADDSSLTLFNGDIPDDLVGKTFKAVTGYILRNVVGEFLLIPVELEKCDTSKVSILNETGAFLWEKLKEKMSFDELEKAMTDEFDVSHEQAREDVIDFLRLLKENELIHIETEVM